MPTYDLMSQVTVPNAAGTGYVTYEIKDAWSRSKIEEIEEEIAGGVHYIGMTTSDLTDGGTTNPIQVITTPGNPPTTKSVTAEAGDIVTKTTSDGKTSEFIFDGTKWWKLGDVSEFGDFAYVDTGTVTVTPHGTVSKPSFTGSSSSVSFTITKPSSGTNYTPEGTVSKPTFTGTEATIPVSITATKVTSGTATIQLSGTVSKPTFSNGTASVSATYTPEGEVSSSFSGTAATINSTGTATGTVSQPTFTGDKYNFTTGNGTVSTIDSISVTTKTTENKTATVSPASSGTATYTPAGTISGTGVTATKQTVYSITNVGSAAELKTEYTSSTEDLKFIFTPNSVPERTAVNNVWTGNPTITDPTFSGTGVRLVTGNIAVPKTYDVSITRTDKTHTHTIIATKTTASSGYTIQLTGTVSKPTFSNGTASVSATYTPAGTVASTFTGTEATINSTGTATGTVSQPTFTGDKYNFSGSATYTPAGSVSQPTFTGTPVKFAGSTTAAGSVSQPTFTGTEETWTVYPTTA